MHSVEIVLDDDADGQVRAQWRGAGARGFAQPGQAHRPIQPAAHHPGVDRHDHRRASSAGLPMSRPCLPIPVALGALLIFGARRFVLARLVVPSAGLLDLQAGVVRSLDAVARSAWDLRCRPLDPACDPGPAAHRGPGRGSADRAGRGADAHRSAGPGAPVGYHRQTGNLAQLSPADRPLPVFGGRPRTYPGPRDDANPSAGRGGSGSAAGRRHRGGRAAPPRTAAQRPAHLR